MSETSDPRQKPLAPPPPPPQLPPGYGPPAGYAPGPYGPPPPGGPQAIGYATPYPQGYQAQENPQAKRLVRLSGWLGWGGLLVLFVGAPAVGVATESPSVGVVVGTLGIVSTIAGAVVGQIGRAMQGRVV